ncbi:MAG: Holliday junction branch migration DNA helicase RuvB [Candidatus Omnitrophica bacterium]|nr:Holliday junction branch migration DNA helicase RuvB [Candidatus Omnitrophota bacterium]
MNDGKSRLETESFRTVVSSKKDEDVQFDWSLRPSSIEEFIGQEQVKKSLAIYIQAAQKRSEPLDHILFFGSPGLGKTTLAHIMAKEMKANIRVAAGPAISRAGDLAGLLTHLEEGDILFIDEIHRLNPVIEEYLYPALEDFSIDIMLDKGPNSRSVRLNLPRFTLIGATTRSGLLTSPLRARFGIVERMNYYTDEELTQVIVRSAKILNLKVEAQGAEEIAVRSRGTPRIANRLLKRVRDYAEVKAKGIITKEVACRGLEMLAVDRAGLDEIDRRLLKFMYDHCDGGPVGLSSLAVGVQEDTETIEEIYEPYLIQKGFLKRTSSGRILTKSAYEHLGVAPKKNQTELWK